MKNRIFLLLPVLFCAALVGCGSSGPPPEAPPKPEWRPILQRALARARSDSLALVNATVRAVGSMTLEFGREDARVKVDDRLRLVKDKGSPFYTEPLAHTVAGDTTLLKDMYTFKDSKGNTRAQQSAQLAGLSFGADFYGLLRALLDGGGEQAGCTLRDSSAKADGVVCYLFSFTVGERSGRFWIDRDSCGLRRIELDQESSYVIGGYKYQMTTDFRRDHAMIDSTLTADLLLPVKTSSRFEYSRLATSGTGSMVVMLDSIRVR